MQRTTQRVSFTTSHRALALKTTKMVFGNDMTSTERFRAAWDEMPVAQVQMSYAERHAWVWKMRYELGLRDTHRDSKVKTVFSYVLAVLMCLNFFGWWWPVIEMIIWRQWPYEMRRENSREYARHFGSDVYFADGKFVKPVFHINPPALTMTADEI